MLIRFLSIALCLAPLSILAQDFSRLDVPFIEDGRALALPLSGGLQNGTFSTIDLNEDALPDLFVFDRAGDKVLTFVNCGSPGQICYEYAPQYEEGFPTDIQEWALMRDFNGDGVEDIFSGFIGGIRVHEGSRSSDGSLSYTLREWEEDVLGFNVLQYPQGSDYDLIYCAGTDVPVIRDIDGDGDLDILSFSDSGVNIYYYKNYSVEFNLTDTLVYRLEDRCWGKFSEGGLSADLFFSPDCSTCGEEGGLKGKKGSGDRKDPLHAGSTLALHDVDGDGDFDIALGDLTGPGLVLAYNEGSNAAPCMQSQDTNFPSSDVPVDIQVFNAAFFLDVNNDGKDDMITTPTVPQQNINHVWLHLNIGEDGGASEFQLADRNFLVEEMLHMGFLTGSAFVDYNADGLLDLLLTGSGIKEDTRPNRGIMQLWENTGTDTNPTYTLVDDDYLNASVLFSGRNDLDPAFADIDADGDQDLFLGSTQGDLYYFENIAGPDAVLDFRAPVHPYPSGGAGIFIGQNAKPALIDIDFDNDLDLVIGEGIQNQTSNGLGSLNLFENTGTASNPIFDEVATERTLYSFTSSLNGQSFNYSDPAYVTTPDGVKLLVGGHNGNIALLEDVLSSDLLNATIVTRTLGGINAGARSTVSAADIDDDGYLEILVGNSAGGFELFNTDLLGSGLVNQVDVRPTTTVTLVPNPTSDAVTLVGDGSSSITGAYLIDGTRVEVGTGFHVSLAHLPPGLVLIEVTDRSGETSIHKIILLR